MSEIGQESFQRIGDVSERVGRPLRPMLTQRGVTPLTAGCGCTVKLVLAVVARPSRP